MLVLIDNLPLTDADQRRDGANVVTLGHFLLPPDVTRLLKPILLVHRRLWVEHAALLEERSRLRTALQYYAAGKHYDWTGPGDTLVVEEGAIARAALVGD